MTATRTYVDAAQTAKLLRSHLKRAFPGTKFSVRTSRYSGGASIDVHWTDGPTEGDVDAVADLYEGADFDGMTDSMSYRESAAIIDGEPRAVHYGADFVHVHRSLSDEFVAAAADFLARNAHGLLSGASECDAGGCHTLRRDGEDVYMARQRWGSKRICCSPECAARVEIMHGHIRPAKGA